MGHVLFTWTMAPEEADTVAPAAPKGSRHWIHPLWGANCPHWVPFSLRGEGGRGQHRAPA